MSEICGKCNGCKSYKETYEEKKEQTKKMCCWPFCTNDVVMQCNKYCGAFACKMHDPEKVKCPVCK